MEERSDIIVSILWGIGIALLFKIIFKNNNCVVVNKGYISAPHYQNVQK